MNEILELIFGVIYFPITFIFFILLLKVSIKMEKRQSSQNEGISYLVVLFWSLTWPITFPVLFIFILINFLI